ncbi:MAG: alanine--tRNA ligase [Candidatus Thermoplasmatota archaeon]|nr:alanine--tRNA ligase [Candidatus Thermoplasmatota archaeon]
MDEFLKKECDLKFFHDSGFIRKKCSSCGAYFWTLDKDAELCGDQPCVEFGFIGNPLGKKPLSLAEVRESFLSFFEKNNHSRLRYPKTGERCTVVARWRTDIYLTIASIADFQPHVTSGEVPPPANPLVISQPCIRLNDLENVGVSGRHLTIFEMMGHHSFNKNIDEIYFKEDTVRFCDEYFVERIGIPREAINYKEQLWSGGGNAGPCLEVLAAGLEIATLVFMNMKEDPDGKFTIDGKKYTNNPLNIVDTGYGLERVAWITQGTPTVYDVVFPKMLKWLKDRTKNTSDMQSIYSLADHSKCLAFMLGDGIVPSNVKAGYLARLIIRRSLRFIEKLQLNVSLKEIVNVQLDLLEKEFPSLKNGKKQIDEILDIETKRYAETLSRGKGLVKKILKEKETIGTSEFITLYDTHGMPPEIVKNIAKNEGISVEIPENFYSMIAELHSHEKKEETKQELKQNLPKTRPLYYENHYTREFDATVIWKNDNRNGTEIILDQTAFYPEGGGQLADKGTLTVNGREITVKHVEKHGQAIIHLMDEKLDVGDKVHGKLDWEHRYTLMKHHTGTHVLNGALRMLLGEHIWQAGSQLGINDARFDFAHYKSITEKEKKEIEDLANKLIQKGQVVEKKIMDRNGAEQTYGFRLYQGGVPPGNSIRVLNIPGIDVEACGGTHLDNINEIEKIRILKTERIQDGVNRIFFAAGKMVDAHQEEENKLYDQIAKIINPIYEIKEKGDVSEQLIGVSKIFSVPIEQVDKTIKRFLKETDMQVRTTADTLIDACNLLFKEWKRMQKGKKKVDMDEIEKLKDKAEAIPGTNVKVIAERTTYESTAIAGAITMELGYVAHIYDGKKITSTASSNVNIDLREIVPEIGKILGGSGGGRPRMIQCGGPNKDKIDEALEKAKQLTKKKLKK